MSLSALSAPAPVSSTSSSLLASEQVTDLDSDANASSEVILNANGTRTRPHLTPGDDFQRERDNRIFAALESFSTRMDALEKRKAVSERVGTPHPAAGAAAAAAAAAPTRTRLFPGSSGVSVGEFIGLGGDDTDAEPADDEYKRSGAAGSSGPPSADHPLFTRLAPDVIADVGSAGFREWLRAEAPVDTWTNKRNLHECELLADALDALVIKQDADAAIEILVRRFVGVRNADISGNWNFAQALSKNMSRRTLLRPSVMSAVLREAKNLSLLENGGRLPPSRRDGPAGNRSGAQGAASGAPGRGQRPRGSGHGNNNNHAAPPQAAHGASGAPAPRAGSGVGGH